MMSKPIRSKRRYALMRQEIIQAARQIIQEQGIDGLSMRTIARLVHTSPANLYEYFLNKEEIIFAVYNDVLSKQFAALKLVGNASSGRAYLLALCMEYIDFVEQNPSQVQIAGYPLLRETAAQSQLAATATPSTIGRAAYNTPRGQAAAGDTTMHSAECNPPFTMSTASHGYVDPIATACKTNTQNIFVLFLQAVEQCIDEGTITSSSLTAGDITHVIWAFVYGLVTWNSQGVSTITRATMFTAIGNFLDGLAP